MVSAIQSIVESIVNTYLSMFQLIGNDVVMTLLFGIHFLGVILMLILRIKNS